ncbi:unnamed protein product [Protopolystoma xenopodis]|uniref:Uncharacterized protein n=1 Tax=Protopolystoma xenopodis TaxID=117903 RepID=A0A3S5C749_9PLAT|nr:unnamed protein product [Protopolystoma xenopodis]
MGITVLCPLKIRGCVRTTEGLRVALGARVRWAWNRVKSVGQKEKQWAPEVDPDRRVEQGQPLESEWDKATSKCDAAMSEVVTGRGRD